MKSCAALFAVALIAALAGDLRAQCQRGGGGGGAASPGLTTSTGTAITATMPIITSAESQYRMMQRLYAQEAQRAYVMQMQQAYLQEQQQAAQAKADKRQQRLTYWREYNEAQKARREETKARNLARRQTDRDLVSN